MKDSILDAVLALWAIVAVVGFILPTVLVGCEMPVAAMKLQAAGMYVYVIVLAICLVSAAMPLVRK